LFLIGIWDSMSRDLQKKRSCHGKGFCVVHDQISPAHVHEAQAHHPGAIILVHPECRPEVIDLADHVASTSGIIRHVCDSDEKEFIIGQKLVILHRLSRECPSRKKCFPLSRPQYAGI